MRSVVFADIDGTLIESLRQRELLPGERVGAHDKNGNPIAIQTPKQEKLLTILRHADVLIPVTGRSAGALQRVQMNFDSYAIVHHGAVLLEPGGIRCREFDLYLSEELAVAHAVLDAAFKTTADYIESAKAGLRIYKQVVDSRTVEVCVKHVDATATDLGPAADAIEFEWREIEGTRVHRNGNNLALLPSTVTKERAVSWVSAKLDSAIGPHLTVGIGDSKTDLAFISQCDFWVFPRKSQIAAGLEGLSP